MSQDHSLVLGEEEVTSLAKVDRRFHESLHIQLVLIVFQNALLCELSFRLGSTTACKRVEQAPARRSLHLFNVFKSLFKDSNHASANSQGRLRLISEASDHLLSLVLLLPKVLSLVVATAIYETLLEHSSAIRRHKDVHEKDQAVMEATNVP